MDDLGSDYDRDFDIGSDIDFGEDIDLGNDVDFGFDGYEDNDIALGDNIDLSDADYSDDTVTESGFEAELEAEVVEDTNDFGLDDDSFGSTNDGSEVIEVENDPVTESGFEVDGEHGLAEDTADLTTVEENSDLTDFEDGTNDDEIALAPELTEIDNNEANVKDIDDRSDIASLGEEEIDLGGQVNDSGDIDLGDEEQTGVTLVEDEFVEDEQHLDSELQEDRKPINYEYANQMYTFEDKNTELHEKYPDGVNFDANGFPDFSPYATETVEVDMIGDHYLDYKAANEAAGLDRTPRGYTWHHYQDGKTMQLIPTDLHSAVRHTGGVSIINNLTKPVSDMGE